ncbi:MAG: aminotransferase class V-fold PLP-dependent enzyme [Pyrinomonadaceae bacterium]
MRRRNFIEAVTGTVGAIALLGCDVLPGIEAATRRTAMLSPQEAAQDETLWRDVLNAFTTDRNIINLDNGNVSPSPKNVTEAMIRYTWQQQNVPGFMLWEVFLPELAATRSALARSFGCDSEEIALVRNATEALQIILLGVPLSAGDEILMTTHDYWSMHDAVDERVRRDKIAVKKINAVPIAPKSMGELLEMYERNITPKTRLILVTHPVNFTGQLFPVKEICEMAHRKGIEVVVDGAQSFGLVDYKLSDLGCDYFGASLHKWLSAPIGTGLLYIRKDKSSKVNQLHPARYFVELQQKDYPTHIFKFEDVGTRSFAMALAIPEALAFHNGIGAKRKEERLRYLTNYWMKRIGKLPNVRFYTSSAPEMSCGLGVFEMAGVDSSGLANHLQRLGIFVQAMTPARAPEVKGVRVTPHLYTMLSELDYFCDVIEQVSKNGLPKSM